jgi:prepilin-type N-terminal cleavage/methylation domain-containing protein/prepilin-type processing-associated H-X9-DG protein
MDTIRTRRLVRPLGFTLVELLVVVAVIGLLAMLLMPIAGSALRSAGTANCKSNVHQIAAAFVMYMRQHSNFMPPSGSPGAKPPLRFPRWYKNLEVFADDAGVFRCSAKKQAAVGYGLNHMWCGPDQVYGHTSAMNNRSKLFDYVNNPSKTVIICDTGVVQNPDASVDVWTEKVGSNVNGCVRFPYDNKPGEPGEYKWYNKDPRRPFPRHSGRNTVCMFFDGHIETIPTSDILDDLWDEPGCIYDNERQPPRKKSAESGEEPGVS